MNDGYYRTFKVIGKKGRICSVMREIVNGTETYRVYNENDQLHFSDIPEEDRTKVLTWLYYNIIPAERRLTEYTSYGMKHILEHRTNIYLSNNQFKEAMLCLGHFPYDPDTLNWEFYIRKKSPMFMMQVDRKDGLPMMGYPRTSADGVSGYNVQIPRKTDGDVFASGFTAEKAENLQKLLAGNGIESGETAVVAQAIGYIFNEEWKPLLRWDN